MQTKKNHLTVVFFRLKRITSWLQKQQVQPLERQRVQMRQQQELGQEQPLELGQQQVRLREQQLELLLSYRKQRGQQQR